MSNNYKKLLQKQGFLKIKNVLNFDYDLKPILNDMEFVMNELIMKFVSKKISPKVLKYDFKKCSSFFNCHGRNGHVRKIANNKSKAFKFEKM